MNSIAIYCDGGARGNPGPAAYGCVIKSQISNLKSQNYEISGYLEQTTNNQAEYQAVIHGLAWIRDKIREQLATINFYLDSQLVVEQLNGNYKVKDAKLKALYWQARDMVLELGGNVSFSYVPRSQNKAADKLVNEVLDQLKN